MRHSYLFTLFIFFSGIFLFFIIFQNPVMAPSDQEQISVTPSIRPTHREPSSFPKVTESQPEISEVNLYFIALNDNGKSGQRIGCGDSIIAVTKKIAPNSTPIAYALSQILSSKTKDYGTSGLYNPLYQSNLKVDSVKYASGTATVHLSGTLKLSGECDNPRVEAQLMQTVLQLPMIKKADIYINDKTLQEALSLK